MEPLKDTIVGGIANPLDSSIGLNSDLCKT